MDELLRVLGQLQEELKRTLSANEIIQAAKEASERTAPIIRKLDELLKELNEVNFPQTLKDLKEIVFTTNPSINDAKEGIKENKRSLEEINRKIDNLKEHLTLLSDKQTKLIDNHFSALNEMIIKKAAESKKRLIISISLISIILLTVIVLLVLFLTRT
jgi:predicted PurR-regulated permease PerM